MILQRWHLFVNDMGWGTEKYIVIFTKTFPIKNSTWGTEKGVAVFAKAFSINLYDSFIKTHLTITKIWWLMTIIFKVTVCIFDSFVCDSGILLHHKILWFCSIVIWAFLALVRICKGVTCLWTSWHDGVQGNRLQSLQKHIPSICFPFFQSNSQNSLSIMASDKHFEGYSLYIWQLCDFGILDHRKILWFCSFVISAFLTLVRFCDLAKMALVYEHHDTGYENIFCNLYKSISINIFSLGSKQFSK